MKLVVAEKPSVAQSLAAVLGAKQKKQGYLEGGGFLVSWCVGHLVGLSGRMRIYRLSQRNGSLPLTQGKRNNSRCFPT